MSIVQSRADVVALFPKNSDDMRVLVENTERAIKELPQRIAKVAAPNQTFENTVKDFDQVQGAVHSALSIIEILQMVHPDKNFRQEAEKYIAQLVEVFNAHIVNDDQRRIYMALCAYRDGNAAHEQLSAERRRALDETIKDFERNGQKLPSEQLTRLRELSDKLTRLELQFNSNVAVSCPRVTATRAELAGISDAFVASLKPDGEGGYLLPVNAPGYSEIMENCTVEATREKYWVAYVNRAYPENESVLHDVIALRDEYAKILGFKSFMHYDLDDQMVKTPEVAIDFLSRVLERTKPKLHKEFIELTRELPPSVALNADGLFKPWDISHVDSQYKKRILNIDEQKISEYLPVQHTIDQMLSIYQQFLGFEFRRESIDGLWHQEVQYVGVYDRSGALVGHLLLDLFPREGKYTHFCHCTVVRGHRDPRSGAVDNPAVGLIIANFPRALGDQPALLKLRDAETFFHEFGHAMHAMCGATDMAMFAGTHVKNDFVEVPSQMFENWLSDAKILKMISKHYKTGESLPDDIIEKLKTIRRINSGYVFSRQVGASLYSLACFAEGQRKRSVDLDSIYYGPIAEFVTIDNRSHFECSFMHLMGYRAKYYSYLWSRSISEAFFDHIKKHNGLLDYTVGKKLVDTVLGRGGSEEPVVLVNDFLGGMPTLDAFFNAFGM